MQYTIHMYLCSSHTHFHSLIHTEAPMKSKGYMIIIHDANGLIAYVTNTTTYRNTGMTNTGLALEMTRHDPIFGYLHVTYDPVYMTHYERKHMYSLRACRYLQSYTYGDY
jgi:hypothetical protein